MGERVMNTSKLLRAFIGALEIFISGIWLHHNASLLYSYNFEPHILHAFMIPEWVLTVNMLVGLCGVWLGVQLWRGKMAISRNAVLALLLLLFGFIFEVFTY